MKTCRVRPSASQCHFCTMKQVQECYTDDCKECSVKDRVYELLDVGVTIFGYGYALVQHGGYIYKVPLNRVFNVKEV